MENSKKKYDLARRELESLLSPFIKNKTVLHVGCLDHSLEKLELNPVHFFIADYSKKCVGIDINKEVIKLRDRGYEVIHGDFYKLNLKNKFDVIFAGEVIEYLPNPGFFLKVAHKHLVKNGLLITTTPNPFFYKKFLEIIFKKEPHVHSYDYFYFCPKTLSKLLMDHEFKPLNFFWLNEASHYSLGYIPIKFRNYFSSNFMIVSKKR